MELRLVTRLFAASIGLFALALLLAAYARMPGGPLIWIAGRGSVALAAAGAVMMIVTLLSRTRTRR
jgi:hypothetical protein